MNHEMPAKEVEITEKPPVISDEKIQDIRDKVKEKGLFPRVKDILEAQRDADMQWFQPLLNQARAEAEEATAVLDKLSHVHQGAVESARIESRSKTASEIIGEIETTWVAFDDLGLKHLKSRYLGDK